MGKYSITRACGHTERVAIYGPLEERARKEQWESGRLCGDCWRAAWEADRAARARAAREEALAAGRPSLIGSAKQVAWAEAIRARHAALLEPLVERAKDPVPGARALLGRVVRRYLEETSAHAWIARRDGLGGNPLTVVWGWVEAEAQTDAGAQRVVTALEVAARIARSSAPRGG